MPTVKARTLERLGAHAEQVTNRLPEANELSVVRSELTGLQVRLKKLRALPELRP
jgi:hypothetical protein